MSRNKNYVPLEEILIGKHPTFQTSKLKNKLLKEAIKTNSCEECGLSDEWNGKLIVMHLDHINGRSDDHRLENLKMLCPNCHSQTPTYSGRNRTNENRLKIEEKKKNRIEKKERELLEKEEKRKKLLEYRIATIKNAEKYWGWIGDLSKILGISHTHVRRIIKTHIPDIKI